MIIELIAKTHADSMIEQEYEFWRISNPDRLAKCSADQLKEFETKQHAEALELSIAIRDKLPLFIKKAAIGMLRPSNRNSRKLFETITGLQLPSTVSGTQTILESYCGLELSAYRVEIDSAKQAKQNAKLAAVETKQNEFIAKMRTAILADQQISGADLVDICRALKVEIHPRTVSMIRNKYRSINSSSAVKSGNRNSFEPYRLYEKCREFFNLQSKEFGEPSTVRFICSNTHRLGKD